MISTEAVSISVDTERRVSGLLCRPAGAEVGCVLAHGAGAGMHHRFMEAVAAGLAGRGVATLRYQFPYMEAGAKRPDRPPLAQATVRGAVAEAGRLLAGMKLIAAGKSFGGRMTSQAQAAAPLPQVRGLAFFGFPLHAAGRPSAERAAHLADVRVPMLFLQGTRDDLADLALLRPVVDELGPEATLRVFEGADHSFHVPARSGQTDAQVMAEMLDAFTDWARALPPAAP